MLRFLKSTLKSTLKTSIISTGNRLWKKRKERNKMSKKKNTCFMRGCIVALVGLCGFLASCIGPSYQPAEIVLNPLPYDGQIFSPDTESVTISGHVIKGDGEVTTLITWEKAFPFLKFIPVNEDLTFSYDFNLDPDAIYSICSLQVIDSNLVANHQRISFALGESAPYGAGVDNGIKFSLTEDGLNAAVGDLVDSVNIWKNAFIYGVNPIFHPHPLLREWLPGCDGNLACEMFVPEVMGLLPDRIDPDFPGIDEIRLGGYDGEDTILPIQVVLTDIWPVNVGDIYIGPYWPGDQGDRNGHLAIGRIGNTDFQIYSGNEIEVDFSLFAESGVNLEEPDVPASLYVTGYRERTAASDRDLSIWIEDDIGFTQSSSITAEIIANSGGISIRPDFGSAELDLHPGMLHIQYVGDFLERIIGAALGLFEPLVHDILRNLADKVFNPPTGGSLLSFDAIGLDLPGVQLNLSAMPGNSVQTNDGLLFAWLHVNPMPTSPPVNPFNMGYLTTDFTGDPFELISFINSDQQFLLALSDDMLNKTLYSIYQSGLLHQRNIKESVMDFLGEAGNEDLTATLSLTVPPVCDFSGADGGVFGKIIVPNMIIDITKLVPLQGDTEHQAKLSVDLDASLEIGIENEEMVAGIDQETSNAVITIMYENFGNTGLLPSIGTRVANELVDGIVKDIVDQVLLSIVNDLHLNITKIEGELVADYLYLKINPDPDPGA